MDHWSDVFPLIFFPFKIIVLAIGAYLSIKWHYDKDKEVRKQAQDHSRPGVSSREGQMHPTPTTAPEEQR